MNATLWVIWIALAVLLFCVGLTIGSQCFPSEQRLDGAWRDGYERGCGDELASCAPCDRPHAAEPPWDDTAEALAERAASYYEPLARGAGENRPVTTAPCPGELLPLKGDSPGPGTCPCCGSALRDARDDAPFCWDCGLYARDPAADCDNEDHKPAVDLVFVPANPGPMPSPIFDALVTEHPKLATPLASPPGGVAPEPSAPAAHALSGEQVQPGAEAKPPAPVRDSSPHSDEGPREGFDSPVATGAGAGADPWQEIVAANQEVWEPFTDTDVFRRISGDLDALRSALSAPVQLPPWKDSR